MTHALHLKPFQPLTVRLAAAVGDSERGTLHIVLTKGNDTALRLTREAEAFVREATVDAAALAGTVAQGDALAATDPREVATAVAAQVQEMTPSLLAAGFSHEDLPPCL